jgi:hypothetical protein
MKIKHYTDVDEQITQIDLECGETLQIQHSVLDKKIAYRVADNPMAIDNSWQSVTLKVEDNLFMVIAKRKNKIEQRVYSDMFGFHIEKLG